MAKALELGTPEEAVGKELKMGDGKLVTVVGVVDDFYSNSLKEGVDNIAMKIAPDDYFTMSIKLIPDMKVDCSRRKYKAIEKIWMPLSLIIIYPSIFDDNIKSFYEQEQ